MSSLPTALVTGASGFVGRHLIERLRGRASITGWHRPSTPPPPPASGADVDWQPIDVRDAAAVRQSIETLRPAQVFHLAGSPHVGSSWATVVPQLEVNVLGTHHVLEAVRRTGHTCRIVVVTSAQIYQPSEEPISETGALKPVNPYGVSKLAADELTLRAATEDGLDVIVARPFNHAGPGQSADFVVSSFARQIASIEAGQRSPTMHVGNLEARRDLTDVRDVVQAYIALMAGGRRGRAYNICSGRAWRIRDLLDELIHLSGIPIQVTIDPALLRPSDTSVLQGDATRIRTELGWMPEIRVEQTLRDTLDAWRSELKKSQ